MIIFFNRWSSFATDLWPHITSCTPSTWKSWICPEIPAGQASETQCWLLSFWGQLCQRQVPSWSYEYVLTGLYCNNLQHTADCIWVNIWHFCFLLITDFFICVTLGDLEKEKRRLQNILATGQDQPTPASSENASVKEPEAERDRCQQGELQLTTVNTMHLGKFSQVSKV